MKLHFSLRNVTKALKHKLITIIKNNDNLYLARNENENMK